MFQYGNKAAQRDGKFSNHDRNIVMKYPLSTFFVGFRTAVVKMSNDKHPTTEDGNVLHEVSKFGLFFVGPLHRVDHSALAARLYN